MLIKNQTIACNDIESDNEYVDCTFKNNSEKLNISDVKFTNCVFDEINFAKSEILDVEFNNIDFANRNFAQSKIYRTRFVKCRLTGADFAENVISEDSFKDSQMNYVNFSGSHFVDTELNMDILGESTFQMIQVKKSLKFVDCQMNAVDFIQSQMKGIDLSKSTISKLISSPSMLKGLIINSYQLPEIAGNIGIKIK